MKSVSCQFLQNVTVYLHSISYPLSIFHQYYSASYLQIHIHLRYMSFSHFLSSIFDFVKYNTMDFHPSRSLYAPSCTTKNELLTTNFSPCYSQDGLSTQRHHLCMSASELNHAQHTTRSASSSTINRTIISIYGVCATIIPDAL